jgi:hypothetical protein
LDGEWLTNQAATAAVRKPRSDTHDHQEGGHQPAHRGDPFGSEHTRRSDEQQQRGTSRHVRGRPDMEGVSCGMAGAASQRTESGQPDGL